MNFQTVRSEHLHCVDLGQTKQEQVSCDGVGGLYNMCLVGAAASFERPSKAAPR